MIRTTAITTATGLDTRGFEDGVDGATFDSEVGVSSDSALYAFFFVSTTCKSTSKSPCLMIPLSSSEGERLIVTDFI
jgi:hypothetical protein